MKVVEMVYFNIFRFLRKEYSDVSENIVIVKLQIFIKLKYYFLKVFFVNYEIISTVIFILFFLNLRKVQLINYCLIKVIEVFFFVENIFYLLSVEKEY